MKYEITHQIPGTFAPYRLTLIVESEEESRKVHDIVACGLAESSEFIRDVFNAGRGNVGNTQGVVPVKEVRHS